MTPEQRRTVEELFELGVRLPKKFLEALGERGIDKPSYTTLTNFLKKLRVEKYGPNEVSVADVEEFVSCRIPEGDDKPFVIHYEAEITDDEQVLRVVFSTKRLLRQAHLSNLLMADGSYKVTYNGFPIVLVGSSDENRRFHPFAMGLVTGETQSDFAADTNVLNVTKTPYKPTILMCDCAQAIPNAFKEVFGEQFLRLVCFYHGKEAFRPRLSSLAPKSKANFFGDIGCLQKALSEEIFEAASSLLMEK